MVILLDLSRSESVRGYDAKDEFARNVQSVTRLLKTLPPGSKVSVIGITDDSFGTPLNILSGQLGDDEGYFKERLLQGRANLVSTWQKRSDRLAPSFKATDILGSLIVASDLFQEPPAGDRKVLVVLSDMKQATRALDVTSVHLVLAEPMLLKVGRNGLLDGDPLKSVEFRYPLRSAEEFRRGF